MAPFNLLSNLSLVSRPGNTCYISTMHVSFLYPAGYIVYSDLRLSDLQSVTRLLRMDLGMRLCPTSCGSKVSGSVRHIDQVDIKFLCVYMTL